MILIISTERGWAYSPFSAGEHQDLDQHLEMIANLSKEEQAEKADFYARFAQRARIIYHLFRGKFSEHFSTGEDAEITSETNVLLTPEDRQAINKTISYLQNLNPSAQLQAIKVFKQTELFAKELARAISVSLQEGFEGYAITIAPTPLFWYQRDFADINKTLGGINTSGLNLDKQNLVREAAVVLPPNTVITLINRQEKPSFTQYEVRTREFDAGSGSKYGFFLDERFIKKVEYKPAERIALLPTVSEVLEKMKKLIGKHYIWGGSRGSSLDQINELFPSSVPLSFAHQQQKIFNGVDCSGLLYYATDTFTPRNTNQLLKFGEAVEIEGLSIDQIIKKLKPLDIVVRAGHVVVVYNQQWSIESRWRANFAGGVELVPLKTRLQEIMKNRTAVNDYVKSPLSKNKKFVIRRWFPS